MKRFLLISLTAIASLSVFSLSSCEADKCKAMVCANNGNCESDGSCTCPVGYEGDRCETVSRDRFKGAWVVDEDGTVSNFAHYTAAIEAGTEINQVNLRNFNNQSNAVITATIVGDSITIPTQSYMVGTVTHTVMGYGKIEAEPFYGQHGIMKLHYQVNTSDGVTNNYGYHDLGEPSTWIK